MSDHPERLARKVAQILKSEESPALTRFDHYKLAMARHQGAGVMRNPRRATAIARAARALMEADGSAQLDRTEVALMATTIEEAVRSRTRSSWTCESCCSENPAAAAVCGHCPWPAQ